MQDVTLDPLETFACPRCGAEFDAGDAVPFSEYTCPQCGDAGVVPGQFGQFQLLERRSESVTSVMFDAYDPRLGRHVTLKILNVILSKNSDLVEAFKREALAAASLNSLYVLKVYEFGVHNRQPYMVMEQIEGRFLHQMLEEEVLDPRTALDIVRGIVQGLRDMREQGLVHGDVMPRNILIHTDGTPRISDFGLARFDGDEHKSHLQSWSSPYYMPPERIQGGPEDFRGDFYSLGTTLFFMLTGHLPYFDLEEERVLERKISEPAPDPRTLRPDLHDALAELTGLLLHRHPDDRPASYDELQEALENVSEFLPRRDRRNPEEPPLPSRPRPKRKQTRSSIVSFVFLTLFGILITMVIALFTDSPPPRNEPSAASASPSPPPPPTPSPTPTPPPTPVPTPTPAPTPTPTPVPAPTPIPLTLERLSRGQHLLWAPDRPGEALAEWRQGDTLLFQQALPSRQPLVVRPRGTPRTALAFHGHHMVSSLTPHQRDAFTLVLVLRPSPASSRNDPQLIIGVRPHETGPTPFGIFAEPTLPGGFSFKTDRGQARLNLPQNRRHAPCLIAFRRSPESQEAFLAGKVATIPEAAVDMPRFPPDHIFSLQLGGASDPRFDFHGWIGAILLADRALTDQELSVVFREFRDQFGIDP